jgi:hypothetical protein
VLIGGVHHEPDGEVVRHECHDLDRALTAELLHHLREGLAADRVVSKQPAPEGDQQGVLRREDRFLSP